MALRGVAFSQVDILTVHKWTPGVSFETPAGRLEIYIGAFGVSNALMGVTNLMM